MELQEGDRQLEIHAVQCGSGKVNAASAVSFLIADNGAQMVCNAGLSGAVSGLRRGDLVAGATYVECDFDLSAIGIPAGQKPGHPWWNLAVQNQATDRAHRIGQKNVVNVYKLIAKDTIEENIVKLQEKKHALADQILSGEDMGSGSFSREEILELLGGK